MTTIDAGLVRTLIADQFPQWRHLRVEPVERQGWDNRTFRLGDELSVRLPSAERYAAGIAKEDHVLPRMADRLPTAVPEAVASGRPGSAYPFPWSVRRWLEGETVSDSPDVDRVHFAADLGRLLRALRAVPTEGGPAAGRHSFFRGCHPGVYEDQVEAALAVLAGEVDTSACRRIWRTAAGSEWDREPVWFHGDVAEGNLLVWDGRLSAVIDFGTCGVGDPACDLVMAWTYFTGAERQAFRAAAGLPAEEWQRARGWALWKALVTMAGLSGPDDRQRAVLAEVLADPVA
ncbi:aminoglycoside phosphotransferase family protein [Arthrobacter sp. TMN-37]